MNRNNPFQLVACPSCGGNMEITATNSNIVCPYCGRQVLYNGKLNVVSDSEILNSINIAPQQQIPGERKESPATGASPLNTASKFPDVQNSEEEPDWTFWWMGITISLMAVFGGILFFEFHPFVAGFIILCGGVCIYKLIAEKYHYFLSKKNI